MGMNILEREMVNQLGKISESLVIIADALEAKENVSCLSMNNTGSKDNLAKLLKESFSEMVNQ